MCGSKLFSGGRFLWFFHLWLLLGTRFLSFWVSKTYRLTGLVPPFSYPEDHFVSLGTPERTMEGHMGAQNQIFSEFGWFRDPVLRLFWVLMVYFFCFFGACFQVTFRIDFWEELLTVGALETRFSHGKYCKNHVFAKTVYWWFEGRFLVFFGGPGSRFSEFFCLGNRLENWVFFKAALGTLNGTRK